MSTEAAIRSSIDLRSANRASQASVSFLAIFALTSRAFYAKLLRKETLACEARFADLRSMDERIAASVDMNVEFAQRAREHGVRRGIDIGFSVQPLIERGPGGTIHPAVYGAIELAGRLGRAIT